MEPQDILELFEENPVVAAVKNGEGLARCLQCDAKVCFVLMGDVCNIGSVVEQVKAAGKVAIVHLDLVEGLSTSDTAVEYIATNTAADGIISTRPQLIRSAKARGLLTIQRFFMLDSMALEKITGQHPRDRADFFEIMPGLMPQIIRLIHDSVQHPIIVGGLITEKSDIVNALNAGAVAVSSTNEKTWVL